MNTAELIYQSSQELSESERLEVFGYINMIKARFGRKKQPILATTNKLDINQSQERLNFLNDLANQAKAINFSIDINDFEQSRQNKNMDK